MFATYLISSAEEKIVTDRASAKTKLKALGLTDDEIKAIKGIK